MPWVPAACCAVPNPGRAPTASQRAATRALCRSSRPSPGPRRPTDSRADDRSSLPGRRAAAHPQYPSAMRPTARDLVGMALFVIVLVGLIVVFVVGAMPARPA